MRKFLITLTIIALVVSIVGTGIIVYIESSSPVVESDLANTESK